MFAINTPSKQRNKHEARFAQLLRDKPGVTVYNCYVYQSHGGRRHSREIDTLLITPRGIATVEVKGTGARGPLVTPLNGPWSIGGDSSPFTTANPGEQASNQAKIAKRFLVDNGISPPWIDPWVVIDGDVQIPGGVRDVSFVKAILLNSDAYDLITAGMRSQVSLDEALAILRALEVAQLPTREQLLAEGFGTEEAGKRQHRSASAHSAGGDAGGSRSSADRPRKPEPRVPPVQPVVQVAPAPSVSWRAAGLLLAVLAVGYWLYLGKPTISVVEYDPETTVDRPAIESRETAAPLPEPVPGPFPDPVPRPAPRGAVSAPTPPAILDGRSGRAPEAPHGASEAKPEIQLSPAYPYLEGARGHLEHLDRQLDDTLLRPLVAAAIDQQRRAGSPAGGVEQALADEIASGYARAAIRLRETADFERLERAHTLALTLDELARAFGLADTGPRRWERGQRESFTRVEVPADGSLSRSVPTPGAVRIWYQDSAMVAVSEQGLEFVPGGNLRATSLSFRSRDGRAKVVHLALDGR